MGLTRKFEKLNIVLPTNKKLYSIKYQLLIYGSSSSSQPKKNIYGVHIITEILNDLFVLIKRITWMDQCLFGRILSSGHAERPHNLWTLGSHFHGL